MYAVSARIIQASSVGIHGKCRSRPIAVATQRSPRQPEPPLPALALTTLVSLIRRLCGPCSVRPKSRTTPATARSSVNTSPKMIADRNPSDDGQRRRDACRPHAEDRRHEQPDSRRHEKSRCHDMLKHIEQLFDRRHETLPG